VTVLTWLEGLWRDIRYGCRMLIGSPAFTIISVLSLAIGIGANCAIFSFADALLLRPLPVAHPDEVFTVGTTTTFSVFGSSPLDSSYRDYVDIRDRSKSFSSLACFRYVTAGIALEANDTPKLKMVMLVTGNLFPLMGIEPVIGRAFRPDEDSVRDRDAVVILGWSLWQHDFRSDPHVLGRTVRINGTPFTVIGVAPPDFTGLDQFVRSDFFVPLMISPRLVSDPKAASLEARDARNLQMKGRLKQGVSQKEAEAELTTIAADLERAYPDTNTNRHFTIRTELQARMAQDPPDSMLVAMLSTLAFGVLLVACANVAGLLLSRSPVRAREMAMRLAVGASRARVVRQLVTESLLIALAGGVVGLGFGYAGMTLFRQIELPTELPISLSFRMDRRALLFSLILAVASAVFSSLVPALRSSGTDLVTLIKSSDSIAPGGRRRWGRAVLVVAQVAVSVLLLAVAMFIYRGFKQQLAGGPGYRTDHLLMMSFDTRLMRYTDTQSQQFFDQLTERESRIPGVKAVTITTTVPMVNESVISEKVVPEGFQLPRGQDDVTVLVSKIDESYFDAMNLTILKGRNFRLNDSSDTPLVAIVNEEFAHHYWPNQDPVGKRFRLVVPDKTWVQVVGLAKTSKYIFIAEPPTEYIYLARRQGKLERMIMLVQSAGDPAALVGPMRQVVYTLDANMPIYNVRTMEEFYRMRAIKIFNVIIATVGGLGAMGLSLCSVGLYGLVSYAATRRKREIAIRMAIGANRGTVLRMVLRQGVALVLIGLVLGLASSLPALDLLRAAFPTGTRQGVVAGLLVVIPIVLAVTFLAAYAPARRASRVHPMQALRQE
jgi:macrolide transport system ATP-binding/permease protein